MDIRVWLSRRDDARIAIILAVILLAFALLIPGFTDSGGNLLVRAATDGIVALGLMTVIVQGELDLSVGSTLALAAAITIGLSQALGYPLALTVAVVAGAAVGMLNGLIVTRVGVNSFIATLGTMVAVRGLAFVITGGEPLSGPSLETAIAFGAPLVGVLTPRVLLLLALALVLALILGRTPLGRDVYAVGGSREAAASVGIPVERRLWLGFVISGVCAAISGATLSIELNSASPVLGSQTILIAITAVVIGGVSLSGGRGAPLGVLFGVLTIAALAVGFNLARLPSSYQQIVTGAILVAVVVLDQMHGRPRWLARLGKVRPMA